MSGGQCLCVLGAATAALLIRPEPVEASFSSDSVKDLGSYLAGGHALNLKLMALETLHKKTDSGVEGEIEKIAKASDARLAIYATTQLGKKGTSTAKTKLKGLVTSTSLKKAVRKAAMTAIAEGWKSSSDLTWLKDKTKGDSDLKGYCSWLETNVYGK